MNVYLPQSLSCSKIGYGCCRKQQHTTKFYVWLIAKYVLVNLKKLGQFFYTVAILSTIAAFVTDLRKYIPLDFLFSTEDDARFMIRVFFNLA